MDTRNSQTSGDTGTCSMQHIMTIKTNATTFAQQIILWFNQGEQKGRSSYQPHLLHYWVTIQLCSLLFLLFVKVLCLCFFDLFFVNIVLRLQNAQIKQTEQNKTWNNNQQSFHTSHALIGFSEACYCRRDIWRCNSRPWRNRWIRLATTCTCRRSRHGCQWSRLFLLLFFCWLLALLFLWVLENARGTKKNINHDLCHTLCFCSECYSEWRDFWRSNYSKWTDRSIRLGTMRPRRVWQPPRLLLLLLLLWCPFVFCFVGFGKTRGSWLKKHLSPPSMPHTVFLQRMLLRVKRFLTEQLQ